MRTGPELMGPNGTGPPQGPRHAAPTRPQPDENPIGPANVGVTRDTLSQTHNPREWEAGMKVEMTVNGRSVAGDVEPRTLLVHFLRDHIGLTGTKVGCDTSSCGACTVHVDGRSVKSCTQL